MDYKDWIQNRAEEIASEKFNNAFCDLSEEVQLAIFTQAMEDHKDHVADQIDREYERRRDKLCQLG